MYFATSCILMAGCLPFLTADFNCPDYELDWICDEEKCRGQNDRDQSEGCKHCEERQREMEEQNNEYYREILDATDPDGAPHSKEEAQEFERGI
ncbi:MAG: hypothetical protein H7A36_06135 [Chlamydiales bacterium]|nr:hypothetical protein [Chlamydiales bacterium]